MDPHEWAHSRRGPNSERSGWPAYINAGLTDMVRTKMNVAEGGGSNRKSCKAVINGASTSAEKVDYLKINTSRFEPPV